MIKAKRTRPNGGHCRQRAPPRIQYEKSSFVATPHFADNRELCRCGAVMARGRLLAVALDVAGTRLSPEAAVHTKWLRAAAEHYLVGRLTIAVHASFASRSVTGNPLVGSPTNEAEGSNRLR